MFFVKYLSFALIAVGIFTAYMALIHLFRKNKTEKRAEEIAVITADFDDEYHNLTPLALALKPFIFLLGINLDKQEEATARLARAGYGSRSALVYYLFFQRIVQPVLLVIGLFILIKLVFYSSDKVSENLLLFLCGLLLSIIGGWGGKLFLKNSADKRAKELSKTFPDALDLILICVESGLGIDAAFARVCKEMKDTHPIVASEFDRTRFEMNMMNDRVQALQNFGNRSGLGGIRTLVSSLIQAERFGTSLVDTMRMVAEEQRADRMMNAEERAARLPALITMPLIFFILPSLFMIILGPSMIKLKEQGGVFGTDNK